MIPISPNMFYSTVYRIMRSRARKVARVEADGSRHHGQSQSEKVPYDVFPSAEKSFKAYVFVVASLGDMMFTRTSMEKLFRSNESC